MNEFIEGYPYKSKYNFDPIPIINTSQKHKYPSKINPPIFK